MGCRPQSIRYPIPRAVQQMTRFNRMGQTPYTKSRIFPAGPARTSLPMWAATPERIKHHVPLAAGVANGTFHKADRFHGRVQVILVGPVYVPHIALIARTAPAPFHSLGPAIKDRLILALIVGPPQRETVLGPYHEGRPMPACFHERRLQRVQFARGHADVNRARRVGVDQNAGVVKKLPKASPSASFLIRRPLPA